MLRCSVLVSGRGSNMEALMQARQRGELPVDFALVATDCPGAPAMAKARSFGVPTWECSPAEVGGRGPFYDRLAAVLHEYGTELVLLAGFMRIIPADFLQHFPNRVINIHPALLPAFPGLHAQRQALEYGVRYSGCTVHFVDAGVDSGAIIDQAVVPVLEGDTEETLSHRILNEEHRLYSACVRLYAEGRLQLNGRRVVILPPGEQSK